MATGALGHLGQTVLNLVERMERDPEEDFATIQSLKVEETPVRVLVHHLIMEILRIAR